MAVEEARKTFNKLVISLVITFAGTLLLSYFLKITTTGQTYTGKFLVPSIAVPVVFILGLLTVGVLLLRSELFKKHK